jgi:nuclear transport factor 2 (NTF2) superfamily protein
MEPNDAARAWVDAWMQGWLGHDADVIASRYAESCEFRSHPFREAVRGRERARSYALQAFAEERGAEPTFGEPIVDPDGRAAVEYRADIKALGGKELRLAGVTVLRFDEAGFVTEHRDYWAMA